MIAQDEKKPPITLPDPDAESSRPTKEEQVAWFEKQAEIDLTAQELFKKKGNQ